MLANIAASGPVSVAGLSILTMSHEKEKKEEKRKEKRKKKNVGAVWIQHSFWTQAVPTHARSSVPCGVVGIQH